MIRRDLGPCPVCNCYPIVLVALGTSEGPNWAERWACKRCGLTWRYSVKPPVEDREGVTLRKPGTFDGPMVELDDQTREWLGVAIEWWTSKKTRLPTGDEALAWLDGHRNFWPTSSRLGSTFTIWGEPLAITCHRCAQTSFNVNDIRERYCGGCHQFHEIIAVAEANLALEFVAFRGLSVMATPAFRQSIGVAAKAFNAPTKIQRVRCGVFKHQTRPKTVAFRASPEGMAMWGIGGFGVFPVDETSGLYGVQFWDCEVCGEIFPQAKAAR